MEEDIKDVRTAAIKFLNAMDKAVDITLVDFDTEVRVARGTAPATTRDSSSASGCGSPTDGPRSTTRWASI